MLWVAKPAIFKIQRGNMDDIVQALNSNDETERIYAAQDMGELNDPEMTVPLVNRLFKEESQLVKDAIVFNLSKMPCTGIYDRLFKMFDSQDAFIRNAAVAIFGSEKDESIGFLTAHLDHANREIRKLILDALYTTGTYEAILAIRAGLHDPSVNVQITAAEYLGILEDKGSVDELVNLIEKDEPMLRFSILEALSCIKDTGITIKLMGVLGAGKDINSLDPIYIPGIIRLAAKSGDLDFICEIFENINDSSLYADDIMRAVGETKLRFKNILEECCILEMTTAIAKDCDLRENIRYNAVELLLGDEKGLLDSNELLSLGKSLISEPSMIYAGIRVLVRSNEADGIELVKAIRSETKNEEIRALCEELIGNLPEKTLSEKKGGN